MDPEQSVLDHASRLTTDERRRSGRELRKRIPRSSFAEWQPAADRVDVVEQLAEQEVTRVAELIPVRHERMAVSPFTFFRGAAKVFAADLAEQPRSGLTVQLCGDAHLSNFGGFASPERTLVFDINDFDETLPGPFEWDLQRLAASVEIACRDNGFDETARRRAQTELVASYAKGMRQFSTMSHLDIWYTQVTLDQVTSQWGDELSKAMRERVTKSSEKAQSKNRLKAFRKLITVVDGRPQFLSDPPLLERVSELSSGDDQERVTQLVDDVMTGYRQSLQPDRRVLLDRYEFVDLARKVVGVGSVGTRCWVALFVGKDDSDPLFLQLKEAEASVMEPHLGPSEFAQHGQHASSRGNGSPRPPATSSSGGNATSGSTNGPTTTTSVSSGTGRPPPTSPPWSRRCWRSTAGSRVHAGPSPCPHRRCHRHLGLRRHRQDPRRGDDRVLVRLRRPERARPRRLRGRRRCRPRGDQELTAPPQPGGAPRPLAPDVSGSVPASTA